MGNRVRFGAWICLGAVALAACGARFEAKDEPADEPAMQPTGTAGKHAEVPDSSQGSGGATAPGGTSAGGRPGMMQPADGGAVSVVEGGAPAAAGDGPGDEVDPPVGLLPVAPKQGDWMWQSQQTRLRSAAGKACAAKLTLAVGPGAVCFTNSQDELVCSGRIDTHTYSPGFQKVGLTGVDQIMLSPTAEGGAICVHTRSGSVQCMGSYNSWGQFGAGDKASAASFVTWGRPNLVGFGSGTWDSMCALDTQGIVACSGYDFGLSPVVQPGSGHHGVWITPFGEAKIDDPDVLRPGEGRTECAVSATQGLVCQNVGYGKPAHVVMGGMGQAWDDLGYNARPCWLEDSGHVECAAYPASPFGEQIVLALAVNYYAKDICAVLQGGSVECVRGNLAGDHQLAPAGSALIDCK